MNIQFFLSDEIQEENNQVLPIHETFGKHVYIRVYNSDSEGVFADIEFNEKNKSQALHEFERFCISKNVTSIVKGN